MLVALLLLFVQQTVAATPADTASLIVANHAVVTFRAPLGALSPADRVNAATVRIDSAVAQHRDSLDTVALPEGLLVRAGGVGLFVLTPGDVHSSNADTLAAAATAAVATLRLGMRDAHEARSLTAVLVGLALVVLATLILVLLLRVLFLGRRTLHAKMRAISERAAPLLEVRGTALLRSGQLASVARHTTNWLVAGLVALAFYVYTGFVLTRFVWTRPWGEALGRYLLNTLEHLGSSAVHAVPKLFTIAIIFGAARFLTGVAHTLFDAVAQRRITIPGIHPDTALPTRRIVNALLWMFAIIVSYPYVPGSDSAAFKGVSVFAGLLLTLGSAGMVGQAMSGLVLMYSRSFRVGQYVQAGAIQGTVVELGLLATRLRTPKNEVVTLPNSVVIGGAVTNYTLASEYGFPLFIYSSVTIGYNVPWRRVHELLIAAATGLDFVLKDPAPFVLQRGLDDSYVEYQVNASIDSARAAELQMLYARLHAAIQDSFGGGGIEIMSPRYLSVRDGNPSTVPPAGS